MTQALIFATPLLLIGLLAAAIPFVLHLLSSVRAQEVYFPTLRFLRLSMEKTARRRRIQHWLLLLLRAALLAALATAVAEPISEATGGWLGGGRHAAAVILDNSLSMGVGNESGNRFTRARDQAAALLAGDERPAMAALLVTNGSQPPDEMTAELDGLRETLSRTTLSYGRAPLGARMATSVRLLDAESSPRKAIYLFTDLQRVSAEDLASVKDLGETKDIHLLVVDLAGQEVGNVGIADLAVSSQRIVDQLLEFKVTVTNSSATDRMVDVALRVDGRQVGQRVRQSLRACGKEGAAAVMSFFHRFSQAGPASGEIVIEQPDDLMADNVWRFALRIGGRVNALVVRGRAAAADAPSLDPAALLLIALNPYGDPEAPWSIRARTAEAEKFSPSDLNDTDIAFFCEVPEIGGEQARAVKEFVRGGGTAVFFLGSDVNAQNYNEAFLEGAETGGGLLPMRIGEPAGDVGPSARARRVEWIDTGHPYFRDLWESESDYLTVLVQRSFQLKALPQPAEVLLRLEGGDPLIAAKDFGRGRVVLCATTASPRWTNLPATTLFLPMVVRMSLMARQETARNPMYTAGAKVVIRPNIPGGETNLGDKPAVVVLPPGGDEGQVEAVPLPLRVTQEGLEAEFTHADRPGVYVWRVVDSAGQDLGVEGRFAVNPDGEESKLEAVPAELFRREMLDRGFRQVYVGTSLAAVRAAAAEGAQGRNWWDVLLVGVILLLVAEAVASNRRRRSEELIPAHLNPRIAS